MIRWLCRRAASNAWLTVAILLALAVPLRAQQATLNLDPARTTVSFTLHDVLHTVHGGFHLTSGEVTFDRSTGKAEGLLIVDATSGDSGNRSRDGRMHREILESAKYMEIDFVPMRIEGTLSSEGESHVAIDGMFRLHGQEHEIEIPADVHIASRDLTADIKFPLTYVNWGVKNPSTFLLRVSSSVDIEIHAVGTLAWADPP